MRNPFIIKRGARLYRRCLSEGLEKDLPRHRDVVPSIRAPSDWGLGSSDSHTKGWRSFIYWCLCFEPHLAIVPFMRCSMYISHANSVGSVDSTIFIIELANVLQRQLVKQVRELRPTQIITDSVSIRGLNECAYTIARIWTESCVHLSKTISPHLSPERIH
jgi:hypothetical protein